MLSEILSNTLSFETCITLYQGHISQSFHQPEGAGSGISDSKVNWMKSSTITNGPYIYNKNKGWDQLSGTANFWENHKVQWPWQVATETKEDTR